jgi:hypothetical protein
MDLRGAGSIRANAASMTEMVSAAVLPASRAQFALMQNEHRPCALTNDEVTLPMAALGSAIDSLGPFVDGDTILDGILRRPAAFVTTREITPRLLGPLGCPIDKGIDRLATHGPQTTFVSSLQPARNLLRGPPFREAVDDFGEWRSLGRWDGPGTGTSATAVKRCSIELNYALCRRHMAWFGAARKR